MDPSAKNTRNTPSASPNTQPRRVYSEGKQIVPTAFILSVSLGRTRHPRNQAQARNATQAQDPNTLLSLGTDDADDERGGGQRTRHPRKTLRLTIHTIHTFLRPAGVASR